MVRAGDVEEGGGPSSPRTSGALPPPRAFHHREVLLFQDYDDYDGYRARDTVPVCPDCMRPELFCDGDHETATELAARLATMGSGLRRLVG